MSDLLIKVAEATRLREGSEGVRSFLQAIFQNEGISTKACARSIRLPIPLVAALKKELIKEDIVIDRSGMWLTEAGKEYCQQKLGLIDNTSVVCQLCQGKKYVVPAEYEHLLNKIRHYLNNRPTVDVTIDQSMCTATTSLRRALLALEYGSLFAGQIAFVGDDDLISISVALLLQQLGTEEGKKVALTVFDIDPRFLEYIDSIADLEDVNIQTVKHDFRKPVPTDYRGQFSAFFTDPPYTTAGGKLFVSRGLELLQSTPGLLTYISFGHKSPEETAALQRELLDMGLAITEIIPGFNEYVGAEIIGNHSQMIIATTTSSSNPSVDGEYQQAIYTGSQQPTRRIYRCKQCGKEYFVGAKEKVHTVEELKRIGCLECGHDVFDLIKKQ